MIAKFAWRVSPRKPFWSGMFSLHMKVSVISVMNATEASLSSEVWTHTRPQSMKRAHYITDRPRTRNHTRNYFVSCATLERQKKIFWKITMPPPFPSSRTSIASAPRRAGFWVEKVPLVGPAGNHGKANCKIMTERSLKFPPFFCDFDNEDAQQNPLTWQGVWYLSWSFLVGMYASP